MAIIGVGKDPLSVREWSPIEGQAIGCVGAEMAGVRTRVGSQVHYQANAASPVFSELKTLMVKSRGGGCAAAGAGAAGGADSGGLSYPPGPPRQFFH